jgi:hypothetical protein
LFEEYELRKMDIQPNSIWYVVSIEWMKNWKLYVGYDGMQGGEFPGPIKNEDIIEYEEHRQYVSDETYQYLNINLKDGLREEDHYVIVDEKIWTFLSSRYGGTTI